MTSTVLQHMLVRSVPLAMLCAAPVFPRPAQQLADRPVEVHVDERCRIFTQDRESADGKFSKPAFREDTDICRVQGEARSKHWEGNIENGVVSRTQVTVVERTYLLHDPTDVPVTFLVEQSVPKGWRVDSTPQPRRMEGQVAIFEVIAKPGETIHLHVGIRK